tara:strand:+ start:494 stop:733 length:240 start_codon:yes stop_codon:yes gene_type:complete
MSNQDDYITWLNGTQEEKDASKVKYSDDHMYTSMLNFNKNVWRRKEYPPLEEQLDMIYHQGIEAWKSKIKEIKDKYPKP